MHGCLRSEILPLQFEIGDWLCRFACRFSLALKVAAKVWRQEKSMTVHLVNLTNPMMMKGPFRELIPVDASIEVKIPVNSKASAVKLLFQGKEPSFTNSNGVISLAVPQIYDHEVVAIDLG